MRRPAGRAPQLDVDWGSFRQSFWSEVVAAIGGPTAAEPFRPSEFFKDSWIERRAPRRAVVAAALWHVAIFVMPYPDFPVAPRRNPAFDNIELTWSGPINDLPELDLPAPKPKAIPHAQPDKPLPPKGADAFHPRQRIFTDPVRPTHPRQTLIQPASLPEPPKILTNLPNIVQLGSSAVPARPRLQISPETLAKLRPRDRRIATVSPEKAPVLTEAQNFTPQVREMNLVAFSHAPEKPNLQINAGSVPRVANRTQSGEAAPAPEVASAVPATAAGMPVTLIAISATPAPPTPSVQVPQGNLAARVSISPEGTQRGVPGGVANGVPGAEGVPPGGSGSNGGTGTTPAGNSISVSISGGEPGKTSGVSGLGETSGKLRVAPAQPLISKPEPRGQSDDAPSQAATQNFGALPPGAKPEAILGAKRVYTLDINMPNLNSVTGSWILNFSEMRTDAPGLGVAPPGDLTGPSPLHKVDPKYPPALRNERVEGDVVLYAVIRKDGSVDSIQLVRGIDDQLDQNAMQALARWRFRPAERQGEPVELEAIVHIPFRAVAPE